MDSTTISRYAAVAALIFMISGCGGANAPTPVAMSGQNQPMDRLTLAAHTQHVLYVSDLNNGPNHGGEIIVYPASLKITNPPPIRTITAGADRPFGVWVDKAGTLYVANQVNGAPNSSITEFHPGKSTPFLTIKDGLSLPQTVAVDSSGTVYVNDSYNGGQIEVYAAGSVHPERTIAVGGNEAATGMAFDRNGNLLAAYDLPQEHMRIFQIAPGSSQPVQLNIDLTGISGPGIGTDAAGNLYIGSQSAGTVSVFPPGQTEPSRVISGIGTYGLLTATSAGALYVASGFSGVSELAPGSNQITNYITGPQASLLRGVALSP